MDALDVVKVCLRRWWVFIPVVALAAGAGLGIVRSDKPSYQSYASFALVYEQPPGRGPQDPDPRLDNPLADNGGALLGEAMLAELATSSRQQELGDPEAVGAEPGMDSHGTRFAVTLPSNSSSYYVNSWSDDEDAAEQTVESVLAVLPTLARSIQDRAGAPAVSQYAPFTTTSPQVTELPPGSPVKIMVGVLGVGLLAGAALGVLVDFLLLRRSSRRRPAEPAAAVARNGASTRPSPNHDNPDDKPDDNRGGKADDTPRRQKRGQQKSGNQRSSRQGKKVKSASGGSPALTGSAAPGRADRAPRDRGSQQVVSMGSVKDVRTRRDSSGEGPGAQQRRERSI